MEAGMVIWVWGVRRPKYLTIYYKSTRSLQGNMRICQGNFREFSGKKSCQSSGILLALPLVQLYGAGTVWSVLQLVSHIYSTWWRHQMEAFSALLAICAGNSPHKGQWRGALIFSLIFVWINGWVNNHEAGDFRRYRAHYDVSVMNKPTCC